MARSALGWGVALALLALGGMRAHAWQRPVPGLNWLRLEGAEQCSSAAVIAARVEGRVPQLVFGAVSEADVFVDGFVRKAAAGGWDVQLEVSAPDGRVWGRRTLHVEGEDCARVDDAVALFIAVTLQPGSELASGEPLAQATAGELDAMFGAEPSEPDARSLPAHAAATRVDAPPPAPPKGAEHNPEPSWSLQLDVAGVGGLGQLPGASIGAAAHVRLVAAQLWPIDLGLSWFESRIVAAESGSSGRGRFNLLLGSLSTCPWSPDWLPAFAACGGAELGLLRAEPQGFVQTPAESQGVVANLLAAGVFRARLLGPLHGRAALLLALPLIQHRYTYRTADAAEAQLYRTGRVSARLELGAGFDF